MAEGTSRLEACTAAVWAKRESKGACLLLKGCSLSAGIFLLLAGCIGFSAIAYGQFVYFIGSFYTVIFGLLVVVVELKDKMPIVSAAYHWVDTYLKFLTVQRGKGAFYWAVGLLICFIAPDGTRNWGVNNVAALILAILGFVHTYAAGTATPVCTPRPLATLRLSHLPPCANFSLAIFGLAMGS